jgi:hypothetical protein
MLASFLCQILFIDQSYTPKLQGVQIMIDPSKTTISAGSSLEPSSSDSELLLDQAASPADETERDPRTLPMEMASSDSLATPSGQEMGLFADRVSAVVTSEMDLAGCRALLEYAPGWSDPGLHARSVLVAMLQAGDERTRRALSVILQSASPPIASDAPSTTL